MLLLVYLFNLGGYTMAFRYFMYTAETGLTRQLEKNNYNNADLVAIRIPLHLPYVQNNSRFERVDGSVENNGVQYNYVKRRVYNDTLYILCLPNQQKTSLVKEKARFAGEVTDFAGSKKDKESSAKKAAPFNEYNNSIHQYQMTSPLVTGAQTGSHGNSALASTIKDTPEHPPRPSC